MPGPSPSSTFTVLLVCTGNICRSAFAERLGRAYLQDRLGADASAVQLVSAGTRAVVGSAMHPDTALVLSGYGAEAGDFRAQQLRDVLIEEADLTLAMTRAHRSDVLGRVPRGLARTFTLREAAELLVSLGEDARFSAPSLPERARALVAGLAAERVRRTAGNGDDIPDPIQQSLEVQADVGELIASSLLPILSRVVDLAAPAEQDGTDRGLG